MAMDVFDDLDRDWRAFARSRRATAALARWATDPELASVTDLDDLLRQVGPRASMAAADRILVALAHRAGDDTVAARVILQALIPGMIRLACRHGGTYRPDVAIDVVSLVAERIRTYPAARRPRRVASNVLLDVHQRLCRTRTAEVRTVAVGTDTLDRLTESDTRVEPAFELVELVVESIEAGALTLDDARILVEPAFGLGGDAEQGAATGIQARSVARRRQRIAHRFVTHQRQVARA